MSATTHVERARRMLEEQIEGIGVIRNGNTRDQGFKTWRQNTLTTIQRLWPADPSKSERFRRVPFSPPSSRADARAMREQMERGCAEAQALLRALIAEVELHGLPDAASTPRPASLAPGVAEDDFPTLDLPGGPARPAAPAPTRPARPASTAAPRSDPAPAAGGPPPFATKPPDAPADPAIAAEIPRLTAREPSIVEEPPAPETPRADEPASERARAPRGLRGPRERGGRNGRSRSGRRLKDMLGFGDEPSRTAEADARASTPAVEQAAPAPRASTPGVPPAAPAPPAADRAAGAPVAAPAPARGGTPDAARTPDAPEAPGSEAYEPNEVDAERVTEDFLRHSPVFSSLALPGGAAPAAAPVFEVPAALAVAALASEVATLDVPEGHRARARAALLDLARRIEHHDLTWEALRDGVTFALEFPAIGRRVLPLLVPYLDQAA